MVTAREKMANRAGETMIIFIFAPVMTR